MADSQQMKPEVFLDTAYAIALSSRTDQYHDKAVELARQLKEEGTGLVTTRAVLLEMGNALSRERYRTAAVRLLEALEADPDVGHCTADGIVVCASGSVVPRQTGQGLGADRLRFICRHAGAQDDKCSHDR